MVGSSSYKRPHTTASKIRPQARAAYTQPRSKNSTGHVYAEEDELDQQVRQINLAYQHSVSVPPASVSPSPSPSLFPLSSSLPLPLPQLPANVSAFPNGFSPDEEYLLLHKLDRKILSILTNALTPLHLLSAQVNHHTEDVTTDSFFLTQPEATSTAPASAANSLLYLVLELLYTSLQSKITLYGAHSVAVLAHTELIIHLLNHTAMQWLQYKQHIWNTQQTSNTNNTTSTFQPLTKAQRQHLKQSSLLWLKQAEQLCIQTTPALSAAHVLTLNHLACCYRLVNKPNTALRLLGQAMEIQLSMQTIPEQYGVLNAMLHYNVSIMLLHIGRGEEAVQHAKIAVAHCQQYILTMDKTTQSVHEPVSPSSPIAAPITGIQPSQSSAISSSQRASSLYSFPVALEFLSHCYHHLGLCEHSLHSSSCVSWYDKAMELATEFIEDEKLKQTFRAAAENGHTATAALEQERTQTTAVSMPSRQLSYNSSAWNHSIALRGGQNKQTAKPRNVTQFNLRIPVPRPKASSTRA